MGKHTKKGAGRKPSEHKSEVISFRVRKELATHLKQTIRELIKDLKTISHE